MVGHHRWSLRPLRKPPDSQFDCSQKFPNQSTTLSITLLTLNALKESSDAFPPLKSAVSGVLHVVDLSQVSPIPFLVHSRTDSLICVFFLQKVQSNKKECQGLALRVQEILDAIADVVPDATRLSPNLVARVNDITSCVI